MRLRVVSGAAEGPLRRWVGRFRAAAKVAIFGLFLLIPRHAAAAEPPLVLLEVETCEELDETEVRRITAAELGARAANIGGDNVTQVTVRCQGSRVNLLVVDPLSRKSVTRSFDIGLADPRARSRLVAIAATELVLASWTELETNPNPHVEPTGTAPSPEAREAAREIAKEKYQAYEPEERTWYELETPKERSFRIVPLFSTRRFFTHPGGLVGGGIRVGEERFKFLAWQADVTVEAGTLNGREADYSVTTSTAALVMFAYLRSGVFTARLGAGLRAGFVTSTPTRKIEVLPTPQAEERFQGTSSLAPWGWPLGSLCLSLGGKHATVELSGEMGYVVLPVAGGGTTMDGGWFSGQFGLGYVF